MSLATAIVVAAGKQMESALRMSFGKQSERAAPGTAAPGTRGCFGPRDDALARHPAPCSDGGIQRINETLTMGGSNPGKVEFKPDVLVP